MSLAFVFPGQGSQSVGMLNALAVRFMRQDYVVLLSNIVDALKDRPEAIRFYMGHELAHIQRRHLTRHWWLAPAGCAAWA